MPRKKRPRVAKMSEVRITRDGDDAVIEFVDPAVSTTHLTLGPKIADMTDEEILDAFNLCVEAQEEMMASYHHVAVEIPPGRPQVEYFAAGDQWTPRGGVLRCIIWDGGPDGEATIEIDKRELSLAEFGKLLTTYAGWGMRICFVPDDELDSEPDIEIRDQRRLSRQAD